MKKAIIALAVFFNLLSGFLNCFAQQQIAPQNLFVLTPQERVLFTAPYTHTWGTNYEDYPLKALWEAFDQDALPIPMVGTGPQNWYTHSTNGSQNHALLWVGEASLAHALGGNATEYDIFAQKAIILLDSLDFVEGHMRHEGIGGYIEFWEGGIAAMALAGLYAPTGSTYGPALLKSARRWWSDHIALLRTLRMLDGQAAMIGARMNSGLTGEYDAGNISIGVNLQMIDPKPHNTLHPYIAALLTADGQPQHGLGGTYAIHWDNPRHVSVRWIVLRAFQSGALLRVPANHSTPYIKRKVYKWTSGSRTHVATPAVVGLPRCRFHVSWEAGQYFRIDLADTVGTSGGYAEPNGHLPQFPLNIPGGAVQILGPIFSTPNPSCASGNTCTNDLAVVSIVKPYRRNCNVQNSISPQVVVKNNGTTTINELALYYQVDNYTLYSELNKGATQGKRYTLTTPIPPGGVTALTLNPFTAAVGTHQIKVWVMDVNKITDVNASNDLDSAQFTVVPFGYPLVYTQDFENTNPGDIPSDWTIYNSDNEEGWFVHSNGTNKAAAFNNYAYIGAQYKADELIMPSVAMPGSGPLWLSFDLCHASQPGPAKRDSLEILISTNCGQTFAHIWGRGGTTLNTVPDYASVFIPAGPQDYQNTQIDLSAYTSLTNATIKFINWSNNGNSTLIDNVHFTTTTTTAIQENNTNSSLNIFPNPSTGVFTVSSINISDFEYADIHITDVLGQNIRFSYSGSDKLEINLQDNISGVYFLEIKNNAFNQTAKLILNKK